MALIPNVQSLQIAGRVFTDVSPNLIKLIAFAADSTNKYGGFRLQTDTAGTAYQVPSGKTLRISAIAVETVVSTAGSTNRCVILGYGTAAVTGTGWSQSTAPTGAAYQGNSSTVGLLGTSGGGTTGYPTNASRFEVAVDFTVPQNDFPFFVHAGAGTQDMTCYAYGYLE